jgi:hypothetical protein
MQPDLFSTSMNTTKKIAEVLRDDGMRRAVDHADRVAPQWSEQALDAVRAFSLTRDHITSEQVRQWAEKDGLSAPPDGRAWGAIMRRAAKEGLIRKIGWTTATDPKVHCNPVSLWEVL